jgi:flagellar biosynthetic protein FliQ
VSSLDLWNQALALLATIAAPFLITALVVGLLVALFQTATQLQESVLSFVPKLAAALIVLALAGHYLFSRLTQFTTTAITTATQERRS